jgi:hypothetical protein
MIGPWVDRLVRRRGSGAGRDTGGCADTSPWAVPIHGVGSIWEGIEAERAYLTEQFGPTWDVESQELFEQEGRHYECLVIALPDGTRHEIIFDIESFYGTKRWY